MKHAMIIIAHKDARSVMILTKILSKSFDVYLHWDFKFPIPSELKNFPNLKILKNRVGCLWGEFSIWESMWISWNQVARMGDYDSYTVLSANDFPLMTPEKMQMFLDNTSLSFLDNAHAPTVDRSKMCDYLVPYGIRIKGLENAIEKSMEFTGDKYKLFNIHDDFSNSFGSQWCTIKHYDLEKMQNYIKKHPEVIKAMKLSFVPDEMFTQYMFTQCKIVSDTCHRRFKFENGSGHPNELTETDLLKIIKRNRHKEIFARKVDLNKLDLHGELLKRFLTDDDIKSLEEVC